MKTGILHIRHGLVTFGIKSSTLKLGALPQRTAKCSCWPIQRKEVVLLVGVTAQTLGLELDRLADLPLTEPAVINSMCTVFAESEVVSLLASGVAKEKIVAGLYHSIARRISSMCGSFSLSSGVIFTGGVARNINMQNTLAQVLGVDVVVPEEPQMIGALGAALVAESLSN